MHCNISLVLWLCFCTAPALFVCGTRLKIHGSKFKVQRWGESAGQVPEIWPPSAANCELERWQLKVISAVPTFGPVGTISLTLEQNQKKTPCDGVQEIESMTSNPIYCSGPNGSHLVKLRLFGRSAAG